MPGDVMALQWSLRAIARAVARGPNAGPIVRQVAACRTPPVPVVVWLAPPKVWSAPERAWPRARVVKQLDGDWGSDDDPRKPATARRRATAAWHLTATCRADRHPPGQLLSAAARALRAAACSRRQARRNARARADDRGVSASDRPYRPPLSPAGSRQLDGADAGGRCWAAAGARAL